MAAVLALGFGSVPIGVPETLATLVGNPPDSRAATIVWDLRVPRIALAILLGANLAAAGALLQSVMQNPLADPGLTGVSTGASVAVLAIILAAPAFLPMVPVAAIIGGAIATTMVYAFAWNSTARGGGLTPIRVILAGVAVNAVFGGVIGMLSLLYSDRLPGALQWLNGSLASVTLGDVALLAPYSLVGWVLLLACIRAANIMRLGDDVARSLGQNLSGTRLALSAVAVYLAGISVATVGIIGFVGLVVPHIARLLVGTNARVHYPLSLLLGGLVLLVADTLGRTIAAPVQIPAGIVMAVVGGPYFLYLMRRRQSA